MHQFRPFREQNAFGSDEALKTQLRHLSPMLADRQQGRLEGFGAWVAGEADAAAAYTDREAPPRLVEGVGDDPALRLMVNQRYAAAHREAYRYGMIGLNHGPRPEPFLLSFMMGYLLSQADISVHCPVTLTGAVALVLDRLAPDALRERYLPPLTRMDGTAATGGTWATEKEGGSDVGASTTLARAAKGGFALSGLKWFCSNAGSDIALATARPQGAPPGSAGLGLYLVPRIKPDGSPNSYRIRRLKEKLGTRGLPTGEIDLLEAFAHEIAPPPRGIKLMIEALEYSRVHNAAAAAGAQRRAFVEALHHAASRTAFGAPILAYPMVRTQLLDIQIELEASLLMAIASAQAFDTVWDREAVADEAARVWLRMLVAVAKFRTAEQAVRAASAAIEMLGGIGYTEEYATARLLRDAQVLTVWEGTANIQALELLRLVLGQADGARIFADRLRAMIDALPGRVRDLAEPVRGGLAELGSMAARLRAAPQSGPRHARTLLELMSDLTGAALLLAAAGRSFRDHDGRGALLARRYIAQRLAGPRSRFDAEDELAGPLAEAVLAYEPIDPTELAS